MNAANSPTTSRLGDRKSDLTSPWEGYENIKKALLRAPFKTTLTAETVIKLTVEGVQGRTYRGAIQRGPWRGQKSEDPEKITLLNDRAEIVDITAIPSRKRRFYRTVEIPDLSWPSVSSSSHWTRARPVHGPLFLIQTAASLPLAKGEFPQIFPRSGWVEHDPEIIWKTQLATARQALRQANLTALDIAAIGITNQRETTVVWDRDTGKPIANAIVWQDRRTADFCEALKKNKANRLIRRLTGLELDAYFSATKINWLLKYTKGEGQGKGGTAGLWHDRLPGCSGN